MLCTCLGGVEDRGNTQEVGLALCKQIKATQFVSMSQLAEKFVNSLPCLICHLELTCHTLSVPWGPYLYPIVHMGVSNIPGSVGLRHSLISWWANITSCWVLEKEQDLQKWPDRAFLQSNKRKKAESLPRKNYVPHTWQATKCPPQYHCASQDWPKFQVSTKFLKGTLHWIRFCNGKSISQISHSSLQE